MIILEQLKTLKGPGGVRTKERNKSAAKFNISNQEHTTYAASNVANCSIESPNMVFLQELNQEQEDQEKLTQFSHMAFKQLKYLQLELLSGTVSERAMHNLQDALDNIVNTKTPEISSLVEEIKLRVAVEIAKIAQRKSSSSQTHSIVTYLKKGEGGD